jgi:NADH dehydrogenase
MARIAIIGGGFAGITAARALHTHDVTLYEPRMKFVFTPLLHEVAGGVLCEESVTVPYAKLIPRVKHVRAMVTRIDAKRMEVVAGGKKTRYDYLIVAPGARSRAVGGLRTFEDARRIHRSAQRAIVHNKTIMVVGGGATGVELAGELADLARYLRHEPKITLVHRRILEGKLGVIAERKLRKKGVRLVHGRMESHANGTAMVDGKKLRADLLVMTTGVASVRIPGVPEATPTLQGKGAPRVFVVGDATGKWPMRAQAAQQQGALAAKNIARLERGNALREFAFTDRGYLVSIGQKDGVGRIMGMTISGFPAWFLMRTIYLFKFHNLRQEWKVACEYTKRLFTRE